MRNRTEDQIKERIREIVIEEINRKDGSTVSFIKEVTDKVHSLCMDEITYRKRF